MTNPTSQQSLNLGLWGVSQSGKTTYLAMMYQQFLSDPDIDIYPTDDASLRFVVDIINRMTLNQVFPSKTTQRETYTYDLVPKERQLSQPYQLRFTDYAGELVENYYYYARRRDQVRVIQEETNPQSTAESPQEMFEDLRDCDGLLILLDPSWPTRREAHLPYTELLYQLLEEIRIYRYREGKDPLRVALVVSKADGDDNIWESLQIFDNTTCYRQRDWDDDWALEHCAQQCPVFWLLKRDFMHQRLRGLVWANNVRCFVVSAIGRILDDNQEGDNEASAFVWRANVSYNRVWDRPPTPKPPAFSETQAEDERNISPITRIPPQASYAPRSISEPSMLNPINLLEPLLWLMQW